MSGVPQGAGPLALWPRWGRWGLVVVLSGLLAAVLGALGAPAYQLLGPMLGCILVSVGGGGLALPRRAYVAAQGMVGCLIGTMVTPGILQTFLHDWPIITAAVLVTLAASSLLGWLLGVLKVLPGTTAVWGTAPGGASAMVVMAEAFGADARMVAVMQYLRVVCVAGSAALLASLLGVRADGAGQGVEWFPAIRALPFMLGLALALGGSWLGRRFRIPAGPLLVPMLAAVVLRATGMVEIQVPPWLGALCYALIGCSIGLGFTRAALVQAASSLPRILLSVFVLIGFCGAASMALVPLMGIDPLTALLAMSPGGLDSVAVIGAASGADLSFVMALQTMRLVAVVLLGPALARMVSRWVERRG
ncbi:AbrB family transcriptional regulator [Roseomonas sp. SSH11]|uniref:AbrB family transcriptional regulator n=1 Tax=Pararoseomonas baculiformis TaxID=2820812 RepID=A0ABS4AC65_9PROT|nr:AbrB family transcriptional regulator [Pararoseomonas baculiformis]MBP0444600.1 AbrB family transcriptional regulator [Pararoseomonas baculiformis]